MSANKVKGRAYTNAEKRQIVERLLVAWKESKGMRLGQLISNAISEKNSFGLFYREDMDLIEDVEQYLARLSST